MAKHKLNYRAERSLRLLLGMRLPRVQQALAPHGFDETAMEEGWDLMRALTLPRRVEREAEVAEERERATRGAVDQAVQLWFTVMRAALRAEHPEQLQHLLGDVPAVPGRLSALYLLGVFQRLGAMQRGEAPFGSSGPVARARLAEHGLTESVEAAVLALAQAAFAPRAANRLTRDSSLDEQASAALWNWYMKWSVIARSVIKNKTLARALGFDAVASRRDDLTLVAPQITVLSCSTMDDFSATDRTSVRQQVQEVKALAPPRPHNQPIK